MVTEAQKRATTKFEHNNYDKVTVRLPKGEREQWQASASAAGMSLNGFVTEAVRRAITGGGSMAAGPVPGSDDPAEDFTIE